MKEERLLVLQLLENGKINSEEAEKLLHALAPHGKAACRGKHKDVDLSFNKVMGQINDFSKDLANKFDDTIKDLEPKFKKTAQVLKEKTTSTVDEIYKSFKKEDAEKEEDSSAVETKTEETEQEQ